MTRKLAGCGSLAILVVLSALVWTRQYSGAAENAIGRAIKPFALADVEGKQHRPLDGDKTLGDKKLTVVAFLGTECPLARLYGPRLVELKREFAEQGVTWLGVLSNTQDSAEDVAAFAKEHGIDFPLLLDPKGEAADLFGAERTPEVFLLDKENVVRYRGRVDDQFGVGLKRPQLGRRDLAEAITELAAGKPVSQPQVAAVGCVIGRAKNVAGDTTVTWSKHIAALMQKHCQSCHRPGEIAPFSVAEYDEVVGWAETILEVVDGGRMPPWFADPKHGVFSNDARMSDHEKSLLHAWVKNGCPEGNRADLPPAKEFHDGWNIPKPDVVVAMRNKPYHVPATGVISYQHFLADPGFTEDKWMVASEVRPGNRAVVHHVLVYLIPPGVPAQKQIMSGHLAAAYAPGSPPRAARPGVAMKIPKGTKILFQMHYTPNGVEQDDVSVLGLKFCDAKDVKQELESGWAINFGFAIPPHAADHPVLSQHKFDEDRLLLQLTPHMHLRGKSFRYEAHYPDGTKEVLLDVPRFDFNWQIDYTLAEPKLMPKGTLLHCAATFDNSDGNPANPDPSKRVRFGEQTWDEMMIGWFVTATVPGAEKSASK